MFAGRLLVAAEAKEVGVALSDECKRLEKRTRVLQHAGPFRSSNDKVEEVYDG